MKTSFIHAACGLLFCLIVLIGCTRKEIQRPDIMVESIELDRYNVIIYVDDSFQLNASLQPENATDKSITWSSSDATVASVDAEGVVKGLAPGGAIIEACASSGRKAFCRVLVKTPVPPTVSVTGVSLDRESADMLVGESLLLTATVSPENADEKQVNWSTSSSAVATVTGGVVKAVGPGSAAITVTTLDGGFQASCTVTVAKPAEPDPDEPEPRWLDSGADLPDYPSYNKVSSLADFPRIDVTWTQETQRLAEGEYTYVDGTVRFRDPKGMYKTENAEEYETDSQVLPMRIRGRGNTSYNAEGGIKHSYRFKLTNADRSAKQPRKVFGMKKDSDWYLLADVQDPTLLRNALALRVSRMVSMPWTPKYRCAEVYFNGKYGGCYLLVEAKEVDRDSKVPVTVVASGETDGGYFLEIDNKQDFDQYFRSAVFNKKIKFKDPEAPDQAQKQYITSYVNEVERLLNACNFDPESGYRSMMEVETFIDNYIVHELTKNMDGGMRLSTYFAKDSDTKLFMPMVWDFDLSLGNYNDYVSTSFNLPDGDSPEGWLIRVRGGSFEDGDRYGSRKSYYQFLFEDPLFVQDLKDRWNVVKPRLDKIPGFIAKMVEYNSLAYEHNAQAGLNPRARSGYWGSATKSFSSWQDAVDYMVDFYEKRLAWLDEHINALQAQHFDANTGRYVDL